jgi:hypothetical protein
MTVMQTRGANEPRHTRASIGSVLLCIGGGIALLIGALSLSELCRDGTFDRCRDGSPSFELVVQAVLAAAGFAATFAVRHFVNRRAYAPARAALAVTILLLAAWLVLVDAATHGWDDLQVPFVLLTIAVISAPLAIVAVLPRRMR